MHILDQDIPLKANLLKSLKKHWILWSVLVVTAVFDFVTTYMFMTNIGISVERNVVVRWLAFNLGVIPGVLVGKSLQVFAAAAFSALSLKYSRAILLLIVGVNLLAILFNLTLVPRTPAP
ncbi:MAG: hypothetical protein JSU95_17175 [Betaproteobacteria bacterium]|nr:MAG: hypothetical protein JSU95_17175 [Betaproteobacteria bacterium]